MKIPILILKLLFIGALFIISNQNLHLVNSQDRGVFFKVYSGWLNHLISQGADVTGYVVKFEWLPDKNSNLGDS